MKCEKCGEALEQSACCGEVPCDHCDGTSCRGRVGVTSAADDSDDAIGHACEAHDPDLR